MGPRANPGLRSGRIPEPGARPARCRIESCGSRPQRQPGVVVGQRQRIGIARALVAKPRLILADEPTGNLNSKQGEEIMELFKNLNREDKVTIIQVTHSEKNAEYGSHIIHLLDGRIEI